MYCPNEECIHHKQSIKNFYYKNGYYKSKESSNKIPRYQCKSCKTNFSSKTFKTTYRQHKPDINKLLFDLLVSGVSLRRASKILDVQYKTIVKRFDTLALQAKELHLKRLKDISTSFVQIDELETYLHARAKPLSVPVMVRPKTGEILGFKIAKMPAKGKLAKIGNDLYNWNVDERADMFQDLLYELREVYKDNLTIKTDLHTSYKKWISKILPTVNIVQVKGGNKVRKRDKEKEFDQLFSINSTFAKMRHDMNRLGRKTWSTTKSIKGLENHLWLYVAWNNKYKLK